MPTCGAKGSVSLPVLGWVVELDEAWVQLLHQYSNDVQEEHEIDLEKQNQTKNRPIDLKMTANIDQQTKSIQAINL